MSIRRDPETGQFVSTGDSDLDVDWHDLEEVWGVESITVPAADNGGGTNAFELRNPGSPMVDFGDVVDSDEVFVPFSARYEANLTFPTTATAEGHAMWRGAIKETPGAEAPELAESPFWGSTGFEDGSIDATPASGSSDDRLWTVTLQGASGFGDSTNGLGAGETAQRSEETVYYMDEYGAAPQLDSGDNLYVIGTLYTDNVSDHAVEVDMGVQFRGATVDIDAVQ